MNQIVVTVHDQAFRASMRGFRERLVQRMYNVMNKISMEMLRTVKEEKLSGQVLNVRTGTLRRSINRRLRVEPGGITASIGTNVPYAAVHEYGAHIPEVSGKLMVFPVPGLPADFMLATGKLKKRWRRQRELVVFTMKHKAFDLPERSFLRSTLTEYETRIREELTEAARLAAEGQ